MDIPIYTIEEVARMLKVAPRTIRQWITDQKLKAFKLGGLVRIHREDLDEFITRSRSQDYASVQSPLSRIGEDLPFRAYSPASPARIERKSEALSDVIPESEEPIKKKRGRPRKTK